MKTIQSDVIIIGGGLTGLTLAHLLHKHNVRIHILEARKRLGGRIHTHHVDYSLPIELGATWLGRQHTRLISLIEKLGIEIFEQKLGKTAIYEVSSTSPPQLVQLPPNDQPSFRIKGGTDSIIKALTKSIQSDCIWYNQPVNTMTVKDKGFDVSTDSQIFNAPIVISTLPPYLFINNIRIAPTLPSDVVAAARHTHTWMGESIKFGLTYQRPFWRETNTSGTLFSNVGPIPEMYDHSNFENSHVALKGFLNGSYFSIRKDERQELILSQLEKYYGAQVRDFKKYVELVWRTEKFTSATYDNHILPHQNNGHQVYQKPYFDGKLYIAGSETSGQYPGYMEGAVRSAEFVYQQIVAQL